MCSAHCAKLRDEVGKKQQAINVVRWRSLLGILRDVLDRFEPSRFECRDERTAAIGFQLRYPLCIDFRRCRSEVVSFFPQRRRFTKLIALDEFAERDLPLSIPSASF